MPSTTVAESRSYPLEDTPDFYIRKQSPIVYLTIGEVERIGSKDPEVQLVIGTLGMLSKRKEGRR